MTVAEPGRLEPTRVARSSDIRAGEPWPEARQPSRAPSCQLRSGSVTQRYQTRAYLPQAKPRNTRD